jgi:hypothetical protein
MADGWETKACLDPILQSLANSETRRPYLLANTAMTLYNLVMASAPESETRLRFISTANLSSDGALEALELFRSGEFASFMEKKRLL